MYSDGEFTGRGDFPDRKRTRHSKSLITLLRVVFSTQTLYFFLSFYVLLSLSHPPLSIYLPPALPPFLPPLSLSGWGHLLFRTRLAPCSQPLSLPLRVDKSETRCWKATGSFLRPFSLSDRPGAGSVLAGRSEARERWSARHQHLWSQRLSYRKWLKSRPD